MKRRAARAALALYPVAFRRRYGAEMEALLDDGPVRIATLLDLARGAIAAHLRPRGAAERLVDLDDRLRASAVGILACFAVFAAAGLGFYKTTEDAPFGNAAGGHLVLAGAHGAVQALAVAAALALTAGAAPLLAATLRAAREDRRVRAAAALAIGAVLAFVAITGLLVALAHSTAGHGPTAVGRIGVVAWALVSAACAATFVLAVRRVLFAAPVSRAALAFALGCGVLVVAAMAAMALATVVYALALAADAGRLAGAPNGPFGSPDVELSLAVQVAAMTLASVAAAISARRGWRRLRTG